MLNESKYSENQHWVPKFLIRNFADSDGRVYCFDIHSGKVSKPPPKRAASEAGFNNFAVGGEVVSFEHRLEKIETRAAPALRRLVESRSLSGTNPEDRKRIAEFAATQSFRTKAFYKGLVEKLDREAFARLLEQLWASAFITANEIEKRHWALMIIETNDVFYLGDHSLVLQRTEKPENGSDLGFDVEGVEAFLPRSPKCALYMPCRTTGDEIINGYRTAISIHGVLRSAILRGAPGGSAMLDLSQRVLRKSHALYRALTEGAPLLADPLNIENLNYLQCSWAHTAIYSCRRDFAFAQRVFYENPQYREVPATSILQRMALVREVV